MNDQTLYSVLGCTSSSTTEQILAEYRARVRNVHPDKESGQESEFCRLQQAKDILTDFSQRVHYDTWLNMGSVMPLKEWMAHRNSIQQTLHWANPPKPTPALTGDGGALKKEMKEEPINWTRQEGSTISAFRNYKI